jgi:glycosyltransferase involved in cell wall biosynthesis
VRILQIIPSLAGRDGGPPKAILEASCELRRRNHEVKIYTTNVDGNRCLNVPVAAPVDLRGIEVSYFPVSGGNYYKLSPSMAGALKRSVAHFELVHIHSLYQFPSTAAAYYARRYGVPYIIQPHGSLDPYLFRRRAWRKRFYEALIERSNLASAAAVLFTSDEEMELARLSGLRFRGAVVPHGVELEVGDIAEREKADIIWPELAGKRTILFLGRINFKKGLDVLARAFGQIRRLRRDVHLVIAGPDTDGYGARVRGWLAEQGALEATTFTGMVLDERKAALLARADLFLLASYTENFGIAVVEAMAAGLPVVISNKVNIWREIEAAQAGVVVNPDAHEAAQAMLALLDNPSAAKEMGERGYRLARERFSWRVVGDQLHQLYQELAFRASAAPVRAKQAASAG